MNDWSLEHEQKNERLKGMDVFDIDEARAQEFANIWQSARRAIQPTKEEIYIKWKLENADTRQYLDTHICTNECTLVCPFEETGDTDLFVCISSHNLHRCNAQECNYSEQNNDHSRTCRVRGVSWFDSYQMARNKVDVHEMQTVMSVTKTESSDAFQRAMCGKPPSHHKRTTRMRRTTKHTQQTPYKCKPDEIHKIEQMILSLFWSERRHTAQTEHANRLHADIAKDNAALCTLAKRTKDPICTIRRQEAYFGRYKAAQAKQSKCPPHDNVGRMIHDWLSRTVCLAYEHYKDYVSILKQNKTVLGLSTSKMTAIRARVNLPEFVLRFIESMREISICHFDLDRVIIDHEPWINEYMPRHSELVKIFPQHEKIRMKRTQIRLILNLARDLHEKVPFSDGPPSLTISRLFGNDKVTSSHTSDRHTC